MEAKEERHEFCFHTYALLSIYFEGMTIWVEGKGFLGVFCLLGFRFQHLWKRALADVLNIQSLVCRLCGWLGLLTFGLSTSASCQCLQKRRTRMVYDITHTYYSTLFVYGSKEKKLSGPQDLKGFDLFVLLFVESNN